MSTYADGRTDWDATECGCQRAYKVSPLTFTDSETAYPCAADKDVAP